MPDAESFVDRLRRSANKARTLGDKWVNVKLAITLNSDDVWAEGLLVFYEVFKFLETALTERRDEPVGRLLVPGLARTKAIEQDLCYYLGSNWVVSYHVRHETQQFVNHMQHLVESDPELLIPYVYHLYVGLMCTAQLVLRKKEMEQLFVNGNVVVVGDAVIHFGEYTWDQVITNLKQEINALGATMDEEKKQLLEAEGDVVFHFTNNVFKSFGSIDSVLAQRTLLFSFCCAALLIVYCLVTY